MVSAKEEVGGVPEVSEPSAGEGGGDFVKKVSQLSSNREGLEKKIVKLSLQINGPVNAEEHKNLTGKLKWAKKGLVEVKSKITQTCG